LDLRKYTTDSDGNEKMLKGLSFLTPEGPHELTNILVEEGYGDTVRIVKAVKERDNFAESIEEIYGNKKKDDSSSDDSFDLRDLI
jgi:hypothetical protein